MLLNNLFRFYPQFVQFADKANHIQLRNPMVQENFDTRAIAFYGLPNRQKSPANLICCTFYKRIQQVLVEPYL